MSVLLAAAACVAAACAVPLLPVAAMSAETSAAASSALIGKKIGTVDVRGNRRIEKDAILAKLVARAGAELTEDLLRVDTMAVYSLGTFEDVQIFGDTMPDGTVKLVVEVVERPVISRVDFAGNERVSTTDLEEVIKVKAWSILDVNKVREDVGLIQKHYEEKGFYLAKVSYEIEPEEGKEDEVVVRYRINDYDKVQIKKITFLNNRHFSDEKLKSLLAETQEGGALSFLSGSGSFKEAAFRQDLQRLTYFYLDNGFVKFRYENPVVTVSEDKRWVFITIYVDEGEPYSMGATDFSGDLLFMRSELENLVTLRQGDRFSITKRNQDIQRLSEKYQDLGYAFTNVVPKMNVKDDTRTVEIDYSFEKGNLVRFGEINIVGNTKTHDKVIRRELRIREGELYNGTRLRLSREAVERLGFFAPGEVVFNTISPKDRADVLDVEISVKERSTGTITLGAGYSNAQGFFFQSQISEINLFGRGQTVSLQAQYAATNESRSFNLGFTDPYAFDTRWTMGFDLFYVNFPIPGRYTTRKVGATGRMGYPIADYTIAYVTYKLENMMLYETLTPLAPGDKEAEEGLLSSVVWSVVRDVRNNRFETTAGNYQSAILETAGLGGDKHFIKLGLNNRYYRKLIGDLVFRNSIEFGHIMALAGDAIPPSERYFLGGPNNLKGYPFFTVGPKRTRTVQLSDGTTTEITEPMGGDTQAFGLFELEYPLIREAGLKVVTFFDVGNSYDGIEEMTKLGVKADVGFGLRWFSPIGPLRFEWGYPIRPVAGELDSYFSFFIGPPF